MLTGLTMAVIKGYASNETIELCWGANKVDIPKAPGLGLLLDKVQYINEHPMDRCFLFAVCVACVCVRHGD